MSTAVVILNYNGANFLKQFLPSVIDNSPSANVLVADNASDDNSLDVLKEYFPEVEVIRLKKNYGFAGGYNKALEVIRNSYEYYVLLNSDIEVSQNWLDPLTSFLDNNPDFAAVQPKIKDYNNRDYFEYAGAAGGFIDYLGYPFCRGRIFDTLEKDHGQYNDTLEVFWATGACLAIRSTIFHDEKGFDEAFFAHMEEIDLCWRLKRKDWKIGVVGNSEVFHVGGGTLSSIKPFKTFLNFRNNLWLLRKNLPSNKKGVVIFQRLILDVIASLKLLISSGFPHFIAVWKAIWYGITNKLEPSTGEKTPERANQGVVLGYFLLKKRKWSDYKISNTK